ncbi:DUF2384 domain-containing protein [Candidatus Woesearchaeota archaeon]|jgi:uncharacterized protein (DUF2384 family)|nr:DUF2384 domain-containing protein [Candidatus Woesearchaeota archaeon]MBT4321657.1 DUF2384 domain-containing protein [Candidatus Woesearchaeota archaeon]MBT4631032.1 DUF2384 domain-containing protein [Candidatus Woesearchaeota archaeon]
MDINDILRKEEFRELENFLNREMHTLAGDFLMGRMLEVFNSGLVVRNWFYSKLPALDYDRPYDYCKDGRGREVEEVLGRIEHGIYS